jgi:hypothetical protein
MATLSARACASLCLLAATTVSTRVDAHGDHGGGGGTVLPAGITLVTVDLDYTRLKPISDAKLSALSDQGVDGAHSLKSIAVPSLSIAYGLTHDLTVGVRLPYLANREIRETNTVDGGFTARGGVYGIGDTTVTATWRFLREQNAGLDVAAIVGLKAPTGRTDAQDKGGDPFETEHQPGSGSWDGVFGLAVSKQAGKFGLTANALYGLAGDGDRQTNLGDRFSYGIGVTYPVYSASAFGAGSHMHLGAPRPDGIMHHGGHSHGAPVQASADTGSTSATVLDLTLGLTGEWHDRQTVQGLSDDNTGGHVLYVAPGLRLTSGLTATTVTFGIPVATHLNGFQSEPDWRVSSSFGVKF